MLDRTILNDRYKIKKMIGGGGMANVYLARDIILDREVAIKVLRLEYANDDEFIARFHREAQSATSLSHPNIVNIYDVGEEDNIYYMVMEYVEGMTLKKYIQNYGPIEVEEALDIMKQLASAIAHAHANDIVHRDIKPQNILIDPFGQIKVTDFGIAVALSATSLTQTNSVLGSVHYLSPEQARGGMANKKSDIYSLGIVLFELLTGRLPFSGESAVSIALKHLQSNTPSIRRWNPNLPQSVENIVLKSTAKDPFHRYETVYEMEDDLETALNPDRINEEAFIPPEDSGEETKAIPIITDQTFKQYKSNEDTIVNKNVSKESEDDTEKKSNKKRNKVIVWTSIILFVLVGSLLAALFIIPSMLQPDDVEIPNVEGMEYEEAYSELTSLNLKVERTTMNSDEVPEGHVIKTDPKAGKTVKEGDTVTVFSSQGKEKITFDNYVGQNIDQVKNLLLQMGYPEPRIYQQFSDRPVGEILTQVPEANTLLLPEETNIIFEVSKGPEKITLENLVGMSEQDVNNYLESVNLSADVTDDFSDQVPEGHVISQDPKAFTQVDENSVVKIVVSKGPEERPIITHTVKFTIDYTGQDDNENPDDPDNPDQEIGQEVLIYVDDHEFDISELYRSQTITKSQEFKIDLIIAPDEVAEYRVVRDGDVVLTDKVSYEDVEGE